jgi:archaemetzincin
VPGAIHIVPVGPDVPVGLLDHLAAVLARIFRMSCRVQAQSAMEVGFALDARRNQYHATSILRRLRDSEGDEDVRAIGVTRLDLFVPILTFVFGEAELGGRCAVVSLQRLDERFYGLPVRDELLRERMVKEAVHELGHTFGLRHCEDWRCVMTSSHAVDRLDVKAQDFCRDCRFALTEPRLLLTEPRLLRSG